MKHLTILLIKQRKIEDTSSNMRKEMKANILRITNVKHIFVLLSIKVMMHDELCMCWQRWKMNENVKTDGVLDCKLPLLYVSLCVCVCCGCQLTLFIWSINCLSPDLVRQLYVLRLHTKLFVCFKYKKWKTVCAFTSFC